MRQIFIAYGYYCQCVREITLPYLAKCYFIYAMTAPTKRRSPRETLEWLCEGDEYSHLWQVRDGTRKINITALTSEINEKTAAGLSVPTLHRAYVGDTDTFSDNTFHTLSLFFDVPVAVIRGDITLDAITEWGMDVTLSELKLIREFRDLSTDGKTLIRQAIRVLRENNGVQIDRNIPGGGGDLNTTLLGNVTLLLPRSSTKK